MFWKFVAAGAAGFLLRSWLRLNELAGENQAKKEAPAAAAMPRGAPPATAAGGAKPSEADIKAADSWSATLLPPHLPLSARLDLMRAVIPMAQWPAYAVRVARWLAMLPGGV